MRSRLYTPNDVHVLQRWLIRNGAPVSLIRNLPKLGYVVPGVGMAFLRMCEGNVAIMDSLITNPLCSPATRHSALETLFSNIADAAATNGVTCLIGFSIDAGALGRAKRHGFQQIRHTVVVKQIVA
jgi:hypothetical protein